MPRFLLLLIFLIWMAWRSEAGAAPPVRGDDLALFFGMYALLVVVIAEWSRLVARRIARTGMRRSGRSFHRITFAAQMFVPIWLGVGTFYLSWGPAVQRMLGSIDRLPVQLPGVVIGTLPALLTWVGLWWAQYAADRATRDQGLLIRFDQDLPIYTSPPLGVYVRQNVRLQILFMGVPILLILALHDLVALALLRGWGWNIDGAASEGVITLCIAVAVFLVSPLILAPILGARTLPASPLRDRMEAMCRQKHLKFRDILLWPTHHRVANAMVMGILPRMRYVLLSDLLLEEMTDEQIEAVFAHELGHVVHRHLVWYVVFLKVLIFLLAVATLLVEAVQHRWMTLPDWVPQDLVMSLVGFGAFLMAFGYVSRRFERQADVFAARLLEEALTPAAIGTTAERPTHVGPTGASVFASALHRVAIINNMPIGSRRRWEGGLRQRLGCLMERGIDLTNNWLHGSIADRMRTLHHMSLDPIQTRQFDRRMRRLYFALFSCLILGGIVAWSLHTPM